MSLFSVAYSFPFQQIGQVPPQKAECFLHRGDLNLPYMLVSHFKVHCYRWQLVTRTLFITTLFLKLGIMLLHNKTSGKSSADLGSLIGLQVLVLIFQVFSNILGCMYRCLHQIADIYYRRHLHIG